MKIILIGFMGSGKTTVAELLAAKLGLPCVDSDQEILKKTGSSSIGDLFQKNGESTFRSLESEVALDLKDRCNLVISTGGGMLLDDTNYNYLKENARIIYLNTSFETIRSRIEAQLKENPVERPLFKNIEEAKERYLSRLPIYLKRATDIVSTDAKSPEMVVADIQSILKTEQASSGKKRCLIIGSNILGSLSPAMHNAGYRALGIENEYAYSSLQVNLDSLAEAIKKLRSENVNGLSVTVPLKEAIIPLLDEIEKTAEKIGAVNTVKNENGRLVGSNSDWLGVLNPLKEHGGVKGMRVALLGAGGAARAAAYALTQAAAHVTIFNRTLVKAEKIAEDFSCSAKALGELNSLSDFDIVINSIPYSSEKNECPINPALLHDKLTVFDMIYMPQETTLLKSALKCGAKVIYGIEMLLHQGLVQFEIFTGRKAPVSEMKQALKPNL